MKMLKLSAICTVAVLFLTSAVYLQRKRLDQRETITSNANQGFAVLELFTSEGCSSCPAADELLERIQREATNKPIYVLAYHVDYWNRLGWKDMFSKPEFSKRQYWYKSKFTSQVYTPQLILNGKTEFVGSDEAEIRKALTSSLDGKAPGMLTLQALQKANGIAVHYRIEGGPVQGQLILALVQKHAVSKVKAGENEGKTLSHAQIVRELNTFALASEGQGDETMALPSGFDPQNWELIGFIQNPDTGEISAAAKTSVTSPSKRP